MVQSKKFESETHDGILGQMEQYIELEKKDRGKNIMHGKVTCVSHSITPNPNISIYRFFIGSVIIIRDKK